jgi:hypothetical protein
MVCSNQKIMIQAKVNFPKSVQYPDFTKEKEY